MKGFDPRTSFGYETSRNYDAVDTRGDEEETVKFLARLASAEALEFAVGTGRIALPLQEAGVRVDGIEMSQHMVDRMREKPGGDQVEVTMGDMSRTTTGRTYGLVYLVYNTIGNLLTQDDQVRCFENAARHLTENGVFVLECRVPTAPARIVRPAHAGLSLGQEPLSLPALTGAAMTSPPPTSATRGAASTTRVSRPPGSPSRVVELLFGVQPAVLGPAAELINHLGTRDTVVGELVEPLQRRRGGTTPRLGLLLRVAGRVRPGQPQPPPHGRQGQSGD